MTTENAQELAASGSSGSARLTLWEFGPTQVIAESPEAAIAAVTAAQRRDFPHSTTTYSDPRAMAPDAAVTLWYESEEDVEDGLKRDTVRADGRCVGCGDKHATDDEYACVTVTMSAAEWCAFYGAGHVIWEFQG